MAETVTAPNVVAILRRHAEERAEQHAAAFVTDPDREDGARWLTYAELDREARSIAVRLREHVAPGDRVVLLYPAGLAFLTAFFGCLYAGAVAVPSSLPGRYRHERYRVKRIADDAGATAILTDTGTRPDVEEWITEEGLDQLPCWSPTTAPGRARTAGKRRPPATTRSPCCSTPRDPPAIPRA
ncbi:AMP-binding protein [Streptomyces rectiviolaceus]|uniref:AMP-binding protein n=1 Tax=Streptomyces rectiviolaceus TaxID=332591 RepID=UPI003633D2B0